MFKPLAITDKQRLHLLIFCRQLLVAATIVQQHRHRALRSQCSQNHWLPFAWCNTQKMKSTFQLWGHVRDTLSASIARHCQEVRLAFRLVCKDRWGWGHLGLLYVKYQSIISRKWYTCRSSSLILVMWFSWYMYICKMLFLGSSTLYARWYIPWIVITQNWAITWSDHQKTSEFCTSLSCSQSQWPDDLDV